ncbi:MAG: PIN domain-containing protein [Acidobacteriota bacterium]|nr:PIN domain-containing protein [Acidobacteriota bacterium]
MAYLPDSNIVLRFAQTTDPLYQIVSRAIDELQQNSETHVLVPQILLEFWVVATRPANVNGLGMRTDEAEKELENLQKLFTVLPENERIFDEWKRLVAKYKVSGKPARDARIVAAMTVHKIENILTLKTGDFKHYTEIKAVRPQDI